MISMPPRASCLRALSAALVIAAIATRASAQEPQEPATPNLASPAGADVVVIIPDSLASAPRTLSELLHDYAPAASVNRSTGALGASAFVSLRDASVVRGDDPLVVIDGIRQVAYRASLDILDRRPPSVLDDIMVDDIAKVEILNGPAAAAEYGYDGQRGAIVVTTRQPGTGAGRFKASVTTSAVNDNSDYTRNLARVAAGSRRPSTSVSPGAIVHRSASA
jgi:outer membrane cobalamin receptor